AGWPGAGRQLSLLPIQHQHGTAHGSHVPRRVRPGPPPDRRQAGIVKLASRTQQRAAISAGVVPAGELPVDIVCLDLEGVLVPEIWINVAERTGIKELQLTTKDIADYDQ